MPIVKKLKYDLDGDGIQTEIKVSINSKGEFSADVPLYLKSCTHKVVSGLSTMYEAINLVDEIVKEYQQLKRTEKWVIIIEFKRDKQHFLNKGIGMKLNYLIANKKQFGRQVSYMLIDKDMNGNYREIGNSISSSRFANEGVVAGESLEIDYSEEKIKTIEDLHSKLEILCSKLSEICNNESQLMQLVGNTFNLLGSGS
jgi:hypothetical protein